jgi:undecaprenyl phosphate-alpha-L-ara4N flippase subunit ArnE
VNSESAVFAFITVVLNGTAQLLLRQAAVTGAVPTQPLTLMRNAWFLFGLVAYAVSVLTWLLVLKRVPLAVAAPFVALVYVIVPLASRLLFADPISTRMWLGMGLVVCGVTMVAQGAPRADANAVKVSDASPKDP